MAKDPSKASSIAIPALPPQAVPPQQSPLNSNSDHTIALHMQAIQQLITNVNLLVANQQSVLERLARGDERMANISDSIKELKDSITTLNDTTSGLRIITSSQADRLQALERRQAELGSKADDHSDILRVTADKLSEHSDRFEHGSVTTQVFRDRQPGGLPDSTSSVDGWISTSGVIKILGVIGSIVAAFMGGKAVSSHPSQNAPDPVHAEPAYDQPQPPRTYTSPRRTYPKPTEALGRQGDLNNPSE